MVQDETPCRINKLEENHDRELRSIFQFQQHKETVLKQILSLENKIDNFLESSQL